MLESGVEKVEKLLQRSIIADNNEESFLRETNHFLAFYCDDPLPTHNMTSWLHEIPATRFRISLTPSKQASHWSSPANRSLNLTLFNKEHTNPLSALRSAPDTSALQTNTVGGESLQLYTL